MTIIKSSVQPKLWPALATFPKICSAILVGSLFSMSVSAQQENDPGSEGSMPPLLTPTPTPPIGPIFGCDLDTTPPNAPARVLLIGVRDTEVDVDIVGAWVGVSDFWGFKVYTTEGVSFQQYPIDTDIVTLAGLMPGTQHSIYATAVDTCANESAPSETITFVTSDSATAYIDTASGHYYAGRLDWAAYMAVMQTYDYARRFQLWQMHDASWSHIDPALTPDAPTNVNVATRSVFEWGYTITWDLVNDADFAYYSVYRDGEFQKRAQEETLTVRNIPQGSAISWAVSATDMSGNESIPSEAYVMNMPWGSIPTPTPTITPIVTPTPVCHEVSTYNYSHKKDGRATSSGSYWTPDYIAVGSGDPMEGSTWGTTILYSFDESYWRVGYCP